MTFSVSVGVAIVIMTVSAAAAAGPCGPGKSRRCAVPNTVVDLNSVPDISKKIVAEEPRTPQPKKPVGDPAAATPYTGPAVGPSPLRRVPTVGYHWALE